MTAAQHSIWIALLVGSAVLRVDVARARITRRDLVAIVFASGLAGVACLAVAAIHTSIYG